MHVLFDQGTPVQIRRSLQEHAVKTAREQGWSMLANGELLRVAEEAGFDVLLTTDKNMRYSSGETRVCSHPLVRFHFRTNEDLHCQFTPRSASGGR